jgi:hypothetical protein
MQLCGATLVLYISLPIALAPPSSNGKRRAELYGRRKLKMKLAVKREMGKGMGLRIRWRRSNNTHANK